MLSTIKIDFENNGMGIEPVIKVVLASSDDPRDKLMKAFFENLRGESSWLFVRQDKNTEFHRTFTITPITPAQMVGNAELMRSRFINISEPTEPIRCIHSNDKRST